MPCSTKRLKPTGGVICAISTTSTTKMPNQSEVDAGLLRSWAGSRPWSAPPSRCRRGSSRARCRRPSARRAATNGDRPEAGDELRELRAAGRCSPSTSVRNDGAREDQRDHAVQARGAHQARREHLRSSSSPAAAERRSAPTTPSAAASVAVAMPHVDRAQHARRSAPPPGIRWREAWSFSREGHRAIGRRDRCRVEQRPDDGVAHEQARQQQARDHAGDEQLA